MDKNVHSENDKANAIIYLLGMTCFMSGLTMMRRPANRKDVPISMKDYNPVYLVKGNSGNKIQEIGFEDKTETMHILDYKTNEEEAVSYDKVLDSFTSKQSN